MWFDSAREVCGSVKVRGKNPKNLWWNDMIKASVERRRLHRRRYMELQMRLQKADVWRFRKKRREKLKRCIYQSKKEVNEQFGKMIMEM